MCWRRILALQKGRAMARKNPLGKVTVKTTDTALYRKTVERQATLIRELREENLTQKKTIQEMEATIASLKDELARRDAPRDDLIPDMRQTGDLEEDLIAEAMEDAFDTDGT